MVVGRTGAAGCLQALGTYMCQLCGQTGTMYSLHYSDSHHHADQHKQCKLTWKFPVSKNGPYNFLFNSFRYKKAKEGVRLVKSTKTVERMQMFHDESFCK